MPDNALKSPLFDTHNVETETLHQSLCDRDNFGTGFTPLPTTTQP